MTHDPEMAAYMAYGFEGEPDLPGPRPLPSAMAECAACGQSILTTPDDPPQTLFCDPCLFSFERRRETRRRNAELNQKGLF